MAGAPDFHVIFGWLQIGRRIDLCRRSDIPEWARYHPHCQMKDAHRAGSLYLSSSKLKMPGVDSYLPGGRRFRRFSPNLRLTASGYTRSVWRLPAWFHPSDDRSTLSYHETPNRWERNGDTVLLRSVGRGQEFVLDCNDYPEAMEWLARLLRSSDTDDTDDTDEKARNGVRSA